MKNPKDNLMLPFEKEPIVLCASGEQCNPGRDIILYSLSNILEPSEGYSPSISKEFTAVL